MIIKLGMVVEARYKGTKRFFKGKVVRHNVDSTFSVEFDMGSEGQGEVLKVLKEDLRIPNSTKDEFEISRLIFEGPIASLGKKIETVRKKNKKMHSLLVKNNFAPRYAPRDAVEDAYQQYSLSADNSEHPSVSKEASISGSSNSLAMGEGGEMHPSSSSNSNTHSNASSRAGSRGRQGGTRTARSHRRKKQSNFLSSSVLMDQLQWPIETDEQFGDLLEERDQNFENSSLHTMLKETFGVKNTATRGKDHEENSSVYSSNSTIATTLDDLDKNNIEDFSSLKNKPTTETQQDLIVGDDETKEIYSQKGQDLSGQQAGSLNGVHALCDSLDNMLLSSHREEEFEDEDFEEDKFGDQKSDILNHHHHCQAGGDASVELDHDSLFDSSSVSSSSTSMSSLSELLLKREHLFDLEYGEDVMHSEIKRSLQRRGGRGGRGMVSSDDYLHNKFVRRPDVLACARSAVASSIMKEQSPVAMKCLIKKRKMKGYGSHNRNNYSLAGGGGGPGAMIGGKPKHNRYGSLAPAFSYSSSSSFSSLDSTPTSTSSSLPHSERMSTLSSVNRFIENGAIIM